MKKIMGALLAAAVVAAAGVTLAADPPASAPGRPGAASSSSLRTYQKETLGLRDELAAKRADLDDEYAKPEPDSARIASLKKEIASLDTKIQVAADKYGVQPCGRGYGRGMMRGMMRSGNGPAFARGSGPGCGCGYR
jgi:peptidoglycan hydrolase CwlO-like protein